MKRYTLTVHTDGGALLTSVVDELPTAVVDAALTAVLEHGTRGRILAQITHEDLSLWVLGVDLSGLTRDQAGEYLDDEGTRIAGQIYWHAHHSGTWQHQHV